LAILKHDFYPAGYYSVAIALISIFVTYMIQRHNFCAGEKLDSSAMIANGYHAGADVLSSSAVVAGSLCHSLALIFPFVIRSPRLLWDYHYQRFNGPLDHKHTQHP